MDIEEAKRDLKYSTYSCLPFGSVMANKEAIETVLSELEKKDKIIELMAKQIKSAEKGVIYNLELCMGCEYMHCTSLGEYCTNNKNEHNEDCIKHYKQYFTNKVEKEGK